MRKVAKIILALTVGVAPVAAWSHARVVSSTPVANAVVRTPARIVLTFNERLIPATARAAVYMIAMPMAAGASHAGMDHSKMPADGMMPHAPSKMSGVAIVLSKDGKTLTLTPSRPLPVGKYRVDWAAAGPDAHPMKGSLIFTVK